MKKIVCILTFFIVVFGVSAETFETFKFESVERTSINPTRYFCVITRESDNSTTFVMLEEGEMNNFFKYYKEYDITEFSGKTFFAKWSDIDLALDYFFTVQKSNEKYKAPTEEDAVEIIVDALLKFKCPDFSWVDSGTMISLLDSAWAGCQVSWKWYSAIYEEVKEKSDGKMIFDYDDDVGYSFTLIPTERFILKQLDNTGKETKRVIVTFAKNEYQFISLN